MSLGRSLYNAVFKRTSTFAVTVAAGAFVFERSFDVLSTKVFDSVNAGKQWKDIKDNYS